MSPRKKKFLAIIGGILLVLVGSLGLAVAAVFSAGTIGVEYEEDSGRDSGRFEFAVPVGLVEMVITFIPDDVLQEVRRDAGEWLPKVESAATALADCPDGILVEVRSVKEQVVVAKSGEDLIVTVQDRGGKLRLSVPLRVVKHAARKFSKPV